MMVGRGERRIESGRQLGVSDQPIAGKSEDWLSLSREACALAEFVARCVTPLTIAVQGDWGSGKTSLLRMIEEHLKPGAETSAVGLGRVEVIRFETSQYAQFGGGPALPLSLLSMLARRLSPPGKLAPITNTLKNLARPAANAAIRGITGGLSQLDDYSVADGSVDFAEQCDRLRGELQEAVRNKREKGIDRFVVLIDDIDRIEPTLAIDILQTIKMFLDLESFVFILALDFAVVKEGVQAKFGSKTTAKRVLFSTRSSSSRFRCRLPSMMLVASSGTCSQVSANPAWTAVRRTRWRRCRLRQLRPTRVRSSGSLTRCI